MSSTVIDHMETSPYDRSDCSSQIIADHLRRWNKMFPYRSATQTVADRDRRPSQTLSDHKETRLFRVGRINHKITIEFSFASHSAIYKYLWPVTGELLVLESS